MVGEIHDGETAEIAVRSAMVGRLLFSTLHTNGATEPSSRLIDMGIEPFLLASTPSLVIAQCLVRRICVRLSRECGADTSGPQGAAGPDQISSK